MAKTIKQSTTLPIHLVDEDASSVNCLHRHSALLPNSLRCIISGPSNCGKTNLMINLLEHPNGLRFANVYVYSKSLSQSKYKRLEKILHSIPSIKYFSFSENEDVVSPRETLPHSVIVFDDVACDKQNLMKAYFSMGRHYGVDVFYLCQTYTQLPKHLLRDNANFIILFRQDGGNLKHVYDDHVNTDMSFLDFKDLCAQCWKNDKYGFIVIDKDSELHNGRYRNKFDEFYSDFDNKN